MKGYEGLTVDNEGLTVYNDDDDGEADQEGKCVPTGQGSN